MFIKLLKSKFVNELMMDTCGIKLIKIKNKIKKSEGFDILVGTNKLNRDISRILRNQPPNSLLISLNPK